MEELKDKVALVTGGASGLGRATAIALAEAGAEVVVVDVTEDAGREVAAQIGGHFLKVDVSDLDENRRMVAEAVELAGGVDLAYLNAGVVSGCGVLEDFDVDKYRRAMGVNLDGVVFGTNAVVPELERRGGGAIVATASLAGLMGMAMDPIYTANKHAVVGFARAMGVALEGRGIRFNAICPGFAESAITAPVREQLLEAGFPMIPAEHVAGGVLSLFTNDVTGEAWFVQAGREPAAFRFSGIPGPRVAPQA